MGIIHEEITFDKIDVENRLTVDDWGEGVEREPYRNISLEVDSMDNFTPEELIDFGKWLIKEGERIQIEYDEQGRPITQSPNNH